MRHAWRKKLNGPRMKRSSWTTAGLVGCAVLLGLFFGSNDEGPMGLGSIVIECKIRINIKIKIKVKKKIRTK